MSNHSYYEQVPGFQLPRCTQICGQVKAVEGLMYYASRETAKWIEEEYQGRLGANLPAICDKAVGKYKEATERAMEIGTVVHENAEDYLLKRPFRNGEHSEEANNAFEQFLAWCNDYHPKVIKTEYRVFNLFDGWAGTVDLLCEIDGEYLKGYKKGEVVRVVVDYKTGGEYREHFYQLYAYHSESESDDYARLCLPKDGKPYTFKLSPNKEQDAEVFDLDVQRWWASHPKLNKAFKAVKAQLTVNELIEMQEDANDSKG